jgi:single-strand DNA-binding protein
MDPMLSQVGSNNTDKAFFTVAVDRRYQRDGEWVSQTSFFAVTAWRDLATQCAQVLEKGLRVIVTGRLESWKPEGEEESRNERVQIVAEDIGTSIRWLDNVTRKPRGEGGASRGSASSRDSGPEASPW